MSSAKTGAVASASSPSGERAWLADAAAIARLARRFRRPCGVGVTCGERTATGVAPPLRARELSVGRRSLAGQLDSRRRAYAMVVDEEGRTNLTFSHVLYTRPDLSWPISIRPYCLGFNLTHAIRKHDWAWLLPRQPDARVALRELPEAFFTCKRSGHHVELFMFTK